MFSHTYACTYLSTHFHRHVRTYPSMCKHILQKKFWQKNQCSPIGENRPTVQPSHGQWSCSQGRTAIDHPTAPATKAASTKMIEIADHPYWKTGPLNISGWVAPQACERLTQPKTLLFLFHVCISTSPWWQHWYFYWIHFTQVDGEFYFHPLCMSRKPNSYKVNAVLGTYNSVLTICSFWLSVLTDGASPSCESYHHITLSHKNGHVIYALKIKDNMLHQSQSM